MGTDDTRRLHLPIPTTSDTFPQVADLSTIWNVVTTARLILRRLQIGDGPAIFSVHGDPATNLYNPFGPHSDLATSEKMLQECLNHWQIYGFGLWAVTLRREEKIIGFGGVEHQVWRDRDVFNLYYRFTPSAWGQGYATEMGQTAVHLAQIHLPQLPIVARVRDANVASKRVAERVGLLRRSDLDTEHVIFALGWTSLNDHHPSCDTRQRAL